MKKLLLTFFLLLATASAFISTARNEYQLPPQEIQDLMMASPIPTAIFNQDASKAVIMVRGCQFRKLAEIVKIKECKVAGVRINANNFSESRYNTIFNDLYFIEVSSGKKSAISGLPQDAKIQEVHWSPDGKCICFINLAADEVELYKVDATKAEPTAEKINKLKVNSSLGNPYTFLPDGRIIYKSVPINAGAFPEEGVPEGPVIQRSKNAKATYRTYQDLIKSEYDEAVFKYLATSVLTLYDGERTKVIGKPAIYRKFTPSPDGNYILTETELGSFSYSKPHGSFPSSLKIINLGGERIATLRNPKMDKQAKKDSLPTKLKWQWRADEAATIAWVEKKDSTFSIWQCEAPFKVKEDKQCLLKAQYSLGDIYWGSDDLAVFYEKSKKDTMMFVRAFAPGDTSKPVRTLFQYSTAVDTVGDAPVFGKPYLTPHVTGNRKLFIEGKNEAILFTGKNRLDGEGDAMWFIDRFDLKKNKAEQIWMAEAPYVSSVIKILSEKKGRVKFISRRESNKVVPQYCILDARGGGNARVQQVTDFENPVPQLDSIIDRFIVYTREDGVKLSGRLYLPSGYDTAKDGRLPLFMWTYPYEYKSRAEAEKYREPRYTFQMPGRTRHIFWATQGYAVFQGFSMPIIASSVKDEPNDDFINQLVMNAKAAINCLDSMGIIDTARVAVGGHSYGSFMTANLMCHTKLFKAGLAESGAFNRSLTPFGFQHEDRTYWKAKKMYNDMSPFNYAHKLSGHILFVHGTMDENTGTHPIQSERMYYAVAGNGGDTDYLQLPYEGHGYIFEENLMTLFHETFQMLEKYVKKK